MTAWMTIVMEVHAIPVRVLHHSEQFVSVAWRNYIIVYVDITCNEALCDTQRDRDARPFV